MVGPRCPEVHPRMLELPSAAQRRPLACLMRGQIASAKIASCNTPRMQQVACLARNLAACAARLVERKRRRQGPRDQSRQLEAPVHRCCELPCELAFPCVGATHSPPLGTFGGQVWQLARPCPPCRIQSSPSALGHIPCRTLPLAHRGSSLWTPRRRLRRRARLLPHPSR